MKIKEKTIIIFAPTFLDYSMTFIFGQLIGASKQCQPLVLTPRYKERNIRENFPDLLNKIEILPCFLSKSEKILDIGIKKIFGIYGWLPKRFYRHWFKLLQDQKVQLIHAHFGHGGLMALPLSKRLETPLLVSFHGFDASQLLRRRAYLNKIRNSFKLIYCIAASKHLADRLINLGMDRSKVFQHHIGIPVGQYPFVERAPIKQKIANKDNIIFFQSSRFVPKKGHRYTINVFARLLSEHPNAQLRLAGDGPLLEESKKQVKDLGISDNVKFLGQLTSDSVNNELRDSDVYLQHSIVADNGDEESTPLSIAEAMSTGLIVISTNHAGIPDMIENGENGFLVEERDEVGYYRAVKKVMSCEQGMGERASETIKKDFNQSTQNEKLCRIYDEVMASYRSFSRQ